MDENRTKRKHTQETKNKIAVSNTGKKFSVERRKNIGLSRQVKVSDDVIKEICVLWSLHYVNEKYIMETYNIGRKIYNRLKKQYCVHEQIKFMPGDITLNEIEQIILLCNNKVPYKDICIILNKKPKQIRKIIIKLGQYYGIYPVSKPKGKHTDEHKTFLKNKMVCYNKENPKHGDKNGNWKNGITTLRHSIYTSKKYGEWRLSVFSRDEFQCVFCSSKMDLEVDHIYPFGLIIYDNKIENINDALSCTDLWDIENGRTLCRKCHKKTETYCMKLEKQIKRFKENKNE